MACGPSLFPSFISPLSFFTVLKDMEHSDSIIHHSFGLKCPSLPCLFCIFEVIFKSQSKVTTSLKTSVTIELVPWARNNQCCSCAICNLCLGMIICLHEEEDRDLHILYLHCLVYDRYPKRNGWVEGWMDGRMMGTVKGNFWKMGQEGEVEGGKKRRNTFSSEMHGKGFRCGQESYFCYMLTEVVFRRGWSVSYCKWAMPLLSE